VIGHVPPLPRYFEQLLLDEGIARLFGALFALARLTGSVCLRRFFGLRARG
jgi:hypothetical protein